MSDLAAGWPERLRPELTGYAGTALENIGREFPAYISSTMTAPGDFPHRPRDRDPVFYGSFDWHSCVEMFWLLVRLLKVAKDDVPGADIRAALEQNFLRWLALATYPLRTGVHTNSSFGISRALRYADLQPDGELSRALRDAVDRWFRADKDYPGAIPAWPPARRPPACTPRRPWDT